MLRNNIGYELRAVDNSMQTMEILPIEPSFASREVKLTPSTEKTESPKKSIDKTKYHLEALEKLLASSDKSITEKRWREVVLKLMIQQSFDNDNHERILKAKTSEIKQLSETVDLLKAENLSLKNEIESTKLLVEKLNISHNTLQELNSQYKQITEKLFEQDRIENHMVVNTSEKLVVFSRCFNKALFSFNSEFQNRLSNIESRIERMSNCLILAKQVPTVEPKQTEPAENSKDLLEALQRLEKLQEISQNLLSK